MRPITRCPGCSRPTATACSSTAPRPATSTSIGRAHGASSWSTRLPGESVPATAAAARAAQPAGSSPAPSPPTCSRRFTRDTGASRRRRRRGCSVRGCSRPAAPPSRWRCSTAPERRRPDLGRPDLPALPAVRRSAGPPRGRAGPDPSGPRARARDHHLRQPDGLHRLRARLRPGGGRRRRWSRTRAAIPTSTGTRPRPRSTSPSSTSPPTPGAPRSPRCSARRSRTVTTAGWRTSGSTRRSTR